MGRVLTEYTTAVTIGSSHGNVYYQADIKLAPGSVVTNPSTVNPKTIYMGVGHADMNQKVYAGDQFYIGKHCDKFKNDYVGMPYHNTKTASAFRDKCAMTHGNLQQKQVLSNEEKQHVAGNYPTQRGGWRYAEFPKYARTPSDRGNNQRVERRQSQCLRSKVDMPFTFFDYCVDCQLCFRTSQYWQYAGQPLGNSAFKIDVGAEPAQVSLSNTNVTSSATKMGIGTGVAMGIGAILLLG